MQSFRVPANNDFLLALGRVIYNFSYLEWGVVYVCATLKGSRTYVSSAGTKTGGQIAKDLRQAILEAGSVPESLKAFASRRYRVSSSRKRIPRWASVPE